MDDEEVGFTTASELREESAASDESGDPTFDIDHPERTHSRAGGMKYEGGTVFVLTPTDSERLAETVDAVLDSGPYRYGDWFDLPMPLFLVHDDGTGDTFRVGVRDGTVRLHVRSATTPEGLRAFYDRLAERLDGPLDVTRRGE